MAESAFTLLQRMRMRFPTAGFLLVGAVVLVLVGIAWIGRAPPAAPDLELVALDRSGRFSADLEVAAYVPPPPAPLVLADSTVPARPPPRRPAAPAAATARFPIMLAVRNRGDAPASADTLYLSVPVRLRLERSAGERLPFAHRPGSPLARYTIALSPVTAAPGAQPTLLPGLDTLWLVPWLPDYYCVLDPAGVPQFVPAPIYDPELLADAVLYWSLAPGGEPRQAGLLRVRLDPSALRKSPAPPLPLFPAEPIGPRSPLPELPALYEAGRRIEACGDPDHPLTIESVLWRTPEGGRAIALHHDGVERKRLYDLDANGAVERVAWDADGDGVLDTQQRAQFPVPEWLLPEIQAVPQPDTLRGAATGTPVPPADPARPPATVRPPVLPDTGNAAGRARADTSRARTDTSRVRTDTSRVRTDTSGVGRRALPAVRAVALLSPH